jgi:ATP-dependent DNA helicase DinG
VSRVYVALDLETTGLDPEHDAIIEIGAVRFRGDEELDTWSRLVNPGQPIPFKIEQLTGITSEEAAAAPPLELVIDDLRRFVSDYPIVGHNIPFDLSFLHRRRLFLHNQAIDTFELASILVPHVNRYSLETLAKALGINFPVQHRALEDAQASRALFLALLEQASRLDWQIIREIAERSARSDWPLSHVFQDLVRSQSRSVFTGGTLGQQLRAKGTLQGEGAYGLLFTPAEKERPLRPAAQPQALDEQGLTGMLEEGGTFAQSFPGYEYRSQQIEMLRAVVRAFNDGEHLLVEAGTGTGKSVAYLLPAIYWATQNGERVVISTNTINLQDQLYHKDIPDLQKIVPVECKVAVLKGRSNYLCPHRFNSFRRRPVLSSEELRVLAKILVWLPSTMTGDQSELFLPSAQERAIWSEICADADICPPERCQDEKCFFYRARRAADSAHLIIVNHALLLADVAVENRVLPEYRYLIIDEAHHLEESITRQLSFSVDQRSIEKLLHELKPPAGAGRRAAGLLAEVLNRCRRALPEPMFNELVALSDQAGQQVERAEQCLYDLFNTLALFLEEHGPRRADYDRRIRLTSSLRAQPGWSRVEIAWDNLAVNLSGLGEELGRFAKAIDGLEEYDIPDYEDILLDLAGYRARLGNLHNELTTLISQPTPQAITWAEVSAKDEAISLHLAPLHIGDLARQHLFEAKASVIMTSATLCTDGRFDFLRERLSAWDAQEVSVGSPFDYEVSTLLYLPTDIPEPGTPGYQRTLEPAMIELCRVLRGRTLALFTSYSQLRHTARAITQPLAEDDIIVYEQGDGSSRSQLLENFKAAERAVLLGTRSFWEGVDVPGEALSCLVIARLPFNVPDEPIFAARSETFDDPFGQYAVPEAILRFRQGFGRLIRTRTDRGVVVIFDSRILTKSYGRMFLNSLPPCAVQRGPLAQLPQWAMRWIEEGPSRRL